MTLNIGDTVLCAQTHGVVWVVRAEGPNGFWHLLSKATSGRGASYYGRLTGAGDVTIVTPRPSYVVGTVVILHDGLACTVAADEGDEVVLNVPASVHLTKGGEGLNIPAGNTVTLNKADIVLNNL